MKILQDTREKFPWDFSFYDNVEVCVQKLDVGDYTLLGMESILTIDRKATTSEIAGNIGLDKKRFEAELEKMVNIKYSYIICEFSIDDILRYPKGTNIPNNKLKDVKITGKFILKKMYEYQEKYGITVCFCKNRNQAIDKAVEILNFVSKMVE